MKKEVEGITEEFNEYLKEKKSTSGTNGIQDINEEEEQQQADLVYLYSEPLVEEVEDISNAAGIKLEPIKSDVLFTDVEYI